MAFAEFVHATRTASDAARSLELKSKRAFADAVLAGDEVLDLEGIEAEMEGDSGFSESM
jgi:hypothetical protein